MQFASLGSGSRGNGTLVRTGETTVLVDCGFSLRETARLMEAEVRKFYGQVNQSLFASDNPNPPAIQAAAKPHLLGDN